MINIDLDSLGNTDINELVEKGREIATTWSTEHKYFQSQYGNPNLDTKQHKQLIDSVDRHVRVLNGAIQELILNKMSHTNTVEALRNYFQQIHTAYSELLTFEYKHSVAGRLETAFLDRFPQLEQSISNEIQEKVDSITETVRVDISKGIKDLLGLKSELGLAKEFGEKIQEELQMAKAGERRFMLAFIGSLIAIPVLNIFLHLSIPNIAPTSSYIVTGSVTFSLLFISYFFYSQYRTYMMLRLRYTHLDGFLGGGATFISQLLESDNQELKLQVNKSLAEMFMSLDDVLHMVHKSKHPTELTLDTAEKVFDKVSKLKK